MASRSAPGSGAASSTPAKRMRTTQPHSYVANIYGQDTPTLVIAKTQKLAHEAIVRLTSASAQDLLKAGKLDWPILDTTADPAQVRVDEAPVSGAV